MNRQRSWTVTGLHIYEKNDQHKQVVSSVSKDNLPRVARPIVPQQVLRVFHSFKRQGHRRDPRINVLKHQLRCKRQNVPTLVVCLIRSRCSEMTVYAGLAQSGIWLRLPEAAKIST